MAALGATDAAQSALTSGQSGVSIATPPTPTLIEIPFVVVFTPEHRVRIHFDDSNIASILSPFETITFVDLSFEVEVTGQSGKLWFAARGSDDLPVANTEWLGSPVFQRFAGNAHGDTFANYRFPSRHPFGLECKSTPLGNPPPRFYFCFKGNSGDEATVRGRLVVRGGGHGIIPAISLVRYADNKSRDESFKHASPP